MIMLSFKLQQIMMFYGGALHTAACMKTFPPFHHVQLILLAFMEMTV